MIAELAAEPDVPILFHDGAPPFSLPSQIGLLAQRHLWARLMLVQRHSTTFGYRRLSLMRASSVVSCQSTPIWRSLR